MRIEQLVAWIGRQDLEGAKSSTATGPVVDFLRQHPNVRATLLSDWPAEKLNDYLRAVARISANEINVVRVKLKDPTDYLGIYRAADAALCKLSEDAAAETIAIHTSPGTSPMSAVWVLLAKTKYPGTKLFKSWLDTSRGPQLAEVYIPFDLTLDVLPDMAARHARLLEPLDATLPETDAFDTICHRSPAMSAALADARRAAVFANSVLILGESGSGKELLARAIHRASPRATKPWGVMNCAALPRDLIDAELFGYAKGSFTGATQDRPGRFEACDGGTIFLDELGDMPAETQVRLLRVLQEGEVQRLGENRVRKVDVRVVAATNRDLFADVRAGRFREDLFYRVAVLLLRLPALRARQEDIWPLTQHFLAQLNQRAASIPGVQRKHLSPTAKRFVESYPWPGNVRELENTLIRCFAMVPGDVLRGEDILKHVLPTQRGEEDQIPLSAREKFSLDKEIEALQQRLIEQALRESGGNRERAAKLLGLRSRQALSHKISKLKISG